MITFDSIFECNMKLREITNYLERIVPLSSQAGFDNCGLLVGDKNSELTSVLICLDCTEQIVEEAINKGANLIIAHHPLIFKGIKSITGANYVERTLLKAIKNDVAIYAIHTNLDHYRYGVNFEIGQRLGLTQLRILDASESHQYKLVYFVPEAHHEVVRNALFDAGFGAIGNYSSCSFSAKGIGTFKPNEGANPFEGMVGERTEVEEVKVEILLMKHQSNQAVQVLKEVHPYEEVAYELIPIQNKNALEGSGMVGELAQEMDELAFLQRVKENFGCKIIRHTQLFNKPIKRVAFCGGSGGFLLNKAKQAKADIFITGDYKYHEFFDAEDEIIIADIGHFESEQYTINLIADILKKKFATFVVHLTEVNTNPINYF